MEEIPAKGISFPSAPGVPYMCKAALLRTRDAFPLNRSMAIDQPQVEVPVLDLTRPVGRVLIPKLFSA